MFSFVKQYLFHAICHTILESFKEQIKFKNHADTKIGQAKIILALLFWRSRIGYLRTFKSFTGVAKLKTTSQLLSKTY